MNWFLIRLNDGTQKGSTFVGSSEQSLEGLVKMAANGEYVCLDNLLYYDRGDIKDWEQWDSRFIPTAYINSRTIASVMQFKADPRTIPRKPLNAESQ